MEGLYTIISTDGMFTGKAYEDEELCCEVEGCSGTQYVVEWEDGKVTIVCGDGLKWISETTAKILG